MKLNEETIGYKKCSRCGAIHSVYINGKYCCKTLVNPEGMYRKGHWRGREGCKCRKKIIIILR